jgi:hypothetical protein
VVLLLLAVTTFSSGCIKNFLPGSNASGNGGDGFPVTPEINRTAAVPENATGPLRMSAVAVMTPAKSSIVTEVAPVITEDPYPIIHGTRINDTPLENPLDRTPDFEKKYHLAGNKTALLVNVAEGPLYIVFQVHPKNDCMGNPDSCRGDLLTTINRPYMTITVQDNQTGEVVAEDGYGQIYSSDTGTYSYSFTSENADSLLKNGYNSETETTTISEPGPRYLRVYKEGTFLVTMEGDFVDMHVWILTGDSPSQMEINNGVMPVETSSEDDF